ncbi:MAG TPA: quinone oxidoreductase [Alphaproteobacteria bacterium]|nr:quinone oxidoreductase [Alphaproteobacteria bacterium]
MRSIRVTEIGEADVLKVATVPVPQPAPGEALVKVAYAGVNFADVWMRRGAIGAAMPVPFTPGLEAAGTVTAVGEDVTDVKPGDRVAWCPIPGAYAEYQAVHAAQLIPLPDGIPFDKAAATILQGLTAHYLVHEEYKIVPGTNVLVHAAAGGMGLLLIQWLKHLGARVIGTVSSDEKAAIAKATGADEAIVYTRQDFAEEAQRLTGGRGVDYIIDGVGQTTFLKNLDAVRVRGTICVFGHASGPAEPFQPFLLMPKSITLAGGMMHNFLQTRDDLLRRAGDVFQGLSEGWLDVHVDRVFPLEQAAEAHLRLENRESVGKLLLEIGGKEM